MENKDPFPPSHHDLDTHSIDPSPQMNLTQDYSSLHRLSDMEMEWVNNFLFGTFKLGNPNYSNPSSSSSSSRVYSDMGDIQHHEDGSSVAGSSSNRKARKSVPPRVAFHTRSSDDVLDDGYRWRKYGQKAVKNSGHPRSYYRCMHHTCNVKKQIQRLCTDSSVVVTTYEGRHNHPSEKLMETLASLMKSYIYYRQCICKCTYRN